MKYTFEEIAEMFPEEDEISIYSKKIILDEIDDGHLIIEELEDGSDRYIHFGEVRTSEEMDEYLRHMSLEQLLVNMCRDRILKSSFNDDGEPEYRINFAY